MRGLRRRVHKFFVEREYPVGRGDPEAARPSVKYSRRRCGLLWLALAAAAVMLYFQLRTPPPDPRVFRESAPVESAEDAVQLSRNVRPLLIAALSRNEMCGAAAPNMRVYQRYAVIRDSTTRLYREIFNPEVVRIHHAASSNSTVQERSSMCAGNRTKAVVRPTAVWMRWKDEAWVQHESLWMGNSAMCLQHFIDVFQGHWPCGHEGADRTRIPISLQ